MWLLDYNTSVAVQVGIIALAGVVMIVYLDEYFDRYQREGRMKSQITSASSTHGSI